MAILTKTFYKTLCLRARFGKMVILYSKMYISSCLDIKVILMPMILFDSIDFVSVTNFVDTNYRSDEIQVNMMQYDKTNEQ